MRSEEESKIDQLSSAEQGWADFERFVTQEMSSFFDAEGPIVGARAPGRLDVMGGVADYSGSIVLEMPIEEAAYVAWQWRDDRILHIRSVSTNLQDEDRDVSISLDVMLDPDGRIRTPEEVNRSLTSNAETRWAAYVAGCFYIMLSAYGRVAQGKADSRLGERGANILLRSEVPQGGGVSSSAAIEVATMHALSDAAGIHPSDLTLAAWCQRVENQIVGAPCGIMDQVTCALGEKDSLLALRCQPHDLLGSYRAPAGWKFIGIDSRVKHSVGGSNYTRARIAAFMGLKVIQLESGGQLLENYLCRMSAAEFAAYRELIPETLTGADYRKLYGQLPDTVTKVDLEETYHPRLAAEHPILENERARAFIGLMHLADLRREETGMLDLGILKEAGSLMLESHKSYSDRLDLGSPETDLLVDLIMQQGHDSGFYGARITGGGSGGTVAVLANSENSQYSSALESICKRYEMQTGNTPRLFVGSSPGAVAFGSRLILRG